MSGPGTSGPGTSDGRAPASVRAAAGVTAGVLCGRWLSPEAGAAFGDTLGWTTLTIAGVAAVAWLRWREGAELAPLDLVTIGLGLIAAGFAASTAWLFVDGGDRRAAVNLTWEMAAVVAGWRLLGPLLGRREGRDLTTLIAALAVGVSAVGFWQCLVFYPSVSAEYRGLRAAEEVAEETGDLATLAEVRGELAAMGVPQDRVSRRVWESRLLDSREPFGFFALANTLGGQLAAAGLVLVGMTLAAWRHDRRRAVVAGLCLAAVAFCLILTKSRTAYAGALAGAVLATAPSVGGRFGVRVPWRALSAGTGVVGVLIVAAWAAGGLDAEVLGEAPKSLAVRLNYWGTAGEIVAANPLLGVGPGQFRSWYTALKPPEASENVLAPHNVVLELWTAGGLAAVAGLALFGFAVARRVTAERAGAGEAVFAHGSDAILPGIIAGGAVVTLGPVVLGQAVDWRAVVAVGIASAAYKSLRAIGSPLSWTLGAVGGLAVHLLGADGGSFGVVWLTALPLVAAGSTSATSESRRKIPIAAVGWTAAALLCVATALWPCRSSRQWLDEAVYLAGRAGPERVDAAFAAAIAADPLAVEPRLTQLEVEAERARATGDSETLRGVADGYRAVLVDFPRSLAARSGLAAVRAAIAERTEDRADVETALAAYDALLGLVPHDARFRAESALFRDRAGLAAVAEAGRALAQDALNRRLGHAEQYLPDATVTALVRIAEADGGEKPGVVDEAGVAGQNPTP